MATLVAQPVIRTGLNPVLVAAGGGGDQFKNTGKEFMLVKNDNASTITVTITTQQQVDGLDVEERFVGIPSGQQRFIGGFPFELYNDTGKVDGEVSVSYSLTASVTVAVIEYNQESFA